MGSGMKYSGLILCAFCMGWRRVKKSGLDPLIHHQAVCEGLWEVNLSLLSEEQESLQWHQSP